MFFFIVVGFFVVVFVVFSVHLHKCQMASMCSDGLYAAFNGFYFNAFYYPRSNVAMSGQLCKNRLLLRYKLKRIMKLTLF